MRKKKDKEKRMTVCKAWRENKKDLALFLFLRGFIIAALILQLYLRNYENVFQCVLALLLFSIPHIAEKQLEIEVPGLLEAMIYLFIFAAAILGEMNAFYQKIPFWDTMLHTINGFICASVGLSLINLLNSSDSLSIRLSPFYVALAAFCFSMTIGVLWEFFEFAMDWFWGMDMQKDTVVNTINTVLLDTTNTNQVITISDIHTVTINGTPLPVDGYIDIGLIDTMKDLFVNFIGAVVFSFYGYFYARHEQKGKVVERMMVTRRDDE